MLMHRPSSRAPNINTQSRGDEGNMSSKIVLAYSEDDNLLHIGHEAGILEDPVKPAAEEIYTRTVAPEKDPDKPTHIVMAFKDGVPIRVENLDDGTVKTRPLELFQYLNQLGKENGIGRMDMVENRFVGVKSRGVYETPGGTILHVAHRDIESIAMDREVKQLIGNLMSGYQRDLGLTKEPLFKAFDTTLESLHIMSRIAAEMKIDAEACAAAMTPEIYATEEDYRLVQQGMSFRDAYRNTGARHSRCK